MPSWGVDRLCTSRDSGNTFGLLSRHETLPLHPGLRNKHRRNGPEPSSVARTQFWAERPGPARPGQPQLTCRYADRTPRGFWQVVTQWGPTDARCFRRCWLTQSGHNFSNSNSLFHTRKQGLREKKWLLEVTAGQRENSACGWVSLPSSVSGFCMGHRGLGPWDPRRGDVCPRGWLGSTTSRAQPATGPWLAARHFL